MARSSQPRTRPPLARHWDAVVVGAGFGGMGAALALAETGARVLLCEALRYPGGCASTFEKPIDGDLWRFEAGATLFSGFGEGQAMRALLDRHGLDLRVDLLDPLVHLRTPDLRLDTPADRDALLARFQALPGAPADGLARFFAFQHQVADTLWALFDDESLLPPLSLDAALRHAGRGLSYAPLLPLAGRPLLRVLERFGVAGFAPLRTWLDAVCQITVQCGVEEVEAAFALGAMDYFFRGTGHVHGGIGVLAEALCGAIEASGGEVRRASRVRGARRQGERWVVDVRGEEVEAPLLIANQLPQDLRELVGADPGAHPSLDRLAGRVADGWGACMLYVGLDDHEALPRQAFHLELVEDPGAPFVEGNHLFVSVSDPAEERGPPGTRTATVSTHVAMSRLRDQPREARAALVGGIQDRMRAGLAALAPEVWEARRHVLPGSPRTFRRFTRRSEGLVGGIPRRAGLAWLRDLWPRPVAPGLYLVGDTAFPGQSTLAATLGGRRVAAAAVADTRPLAPAG